MLSAPWIQLFTATAWACDAPPIPGLHVTAPIGWTTDGRWFVYAFDRVDEAGETTQGVGALDTLTDTTTYVTLESFRAEHPMAPLDVGPTCGAATLVQKDEELGGYGSYEGHQETNGYAFAQSLSTWLTLGVTADGQTWTHAEFGYERFLQVSHAWAPGCHHLAWLLQGGYQEYSPRARTPIGPYSPRMGLLVKPVGPVVHVMAHPSATAAVDPTIAALTAAGFAPHVGPAALQDRDYTVVYTALAARADAARIAAAVPGGATIEALTWTTPADVVVAAGLSAVRP
jgi:hypothetical protein